jgi:hypothetical protein
MPIKVNPGVPALQSPASDGPRHTPRGHNLNYTIWTLYAESVSFLSHATFLWGVPSEIWGAPSEFWGARAEIYQAIWGARAKIYQAIWGAPREISQGDWGALTFLSKNNVPKT